MFQLVADWMRQPTRRQPASQPASRIDCHWDESESTRHLGEGPGSGRRGRQLRLAPAQMLSEPSGSLTEANPNLVVRTWRAAGWLVERHN